MTTETIIQLLSYIFDFDNNLANIIYVIFFSIILSRWSNFIVDIIHLFQNAISAALRGYPCDPIIYSAGWIIIFFEIKFVKSLKNFRRDKLFLFKHKTYLSNIY